MISTVTSTTISVVTDLSLSGSAALISSLILLTMLIEKELASGFNARFARVLNRALDIAIIPLLMVFVLNITVRFVNILK
jgi:hypothetical protein